MSGRTHGRKGRLLVSLDGTAAASLVAYVSGYDISFSTDKAEVTSFGDSNKTYAAGLPDASGSIKGFVDLAGSSSQTQALYNAASDGVPRGFYLYTDTTDLTKNYVYGTALFDFSMSGAVDAAVSFTSQVTAAGSVGLKLA